MIDPAIAGTLIAPAGYFAGEFPAQQMLLPVLLNTFPTRIDKPVTAAVTGLCTSP